LVADFSLCENNFGQSKSQLKACEDMPECDNNAELLEERVSADFKINGVFPRLVHKKI
jgi:hypothetical protein